MSKVTLYSTGCPRCRVLSSKLDQNGIVYNTVTDPDVMVEKGLQTAPALEVDGNMKDFGDAVRWINNQGAEE